MQFSCFKHFFFSFEWPVICAYFCFVLKCQAYAGHIHSWVGPQTHSPLLVTLAHKHTCDRWKRRRYAASLYAVMSCVCLKTHDHGAPHINLSMRQMRLACLIKKLCTYLGSNFLLRNPTKSHRMQNTFWLENTCKFIGRKRGSYSVFDKIEHPLCRPKFMHGKKTLKR